MNVSRETIMTALFSLLTGTLTNTFTANSTDGSAVLSDVSTVAGLVEGAPVFGPGIPSGAVLLTIGTTTVTLSLAATATASAVSFTTGFQTTGRRVLLWSKVPNQPALFVRNIGDDHDYPGTVLPKVTIKAEAWIYSNAGEHPDLVPGVALNNIVDAVEAAFVPDPITQRLTLGGLVNNCWIEGESVFDPGDLDGQAKAVIPIRILVP